MSEVRFTREGQFWLDHETGRTFPRVAGADPAAELEEAPATGALPREGLVVRALPGGLELRAAAADPAEAASNNPNGMPTLYGHFAVFNVWTEINSYWEGNFLERFAPGAFKKTFREQRDKMRVLFQHGMDPQVGDKPLGPIADLREDDIGAYYEVPLLDTSYTRDLIPGLEEDLYGCSFRFGVLRETIVEEPPPSAENPKGLPERTVQEARVPEFGPVTFPAYDEASAGVRSLTDEFIVARFGGPERLRALLEAAPDLRASRTSAEPAPSEDDRAAGREDAPERRNQQDEEAPTGAVSTSPAAPGTRPTPLHLTSRSNTRKRGKPWLLP